MANTPARVCPLAKKCGGCQLQNLSYDEQLHLKQATAIRLLGRFGHVEEIIGMKDPYHYRNKVQAAFGVNRQGQIISGVYQSASHRIVPVSDCMIEDTVADQIIVTIRGLLKSFKIRPYDEDTGRGTLRHVLVRRGWRSGEILVVLVTAHGMLPGKRNFVRALLQRHPDITTIVQNINAGQTSLVLGPHSEVLYGPGYIRERLGDFTFRISPRAFYQINPVQTEVLYRTALDYAGLTGKETVVDAYCGTGTIGIFASRNAARRQRRALSRRRDGRRAGAGGVRVVQPGDARARPGLSHPARLPRHTHPAGGHVPAHGAYRGRRGIGQKLTKRELKSHRSASCAAVASFLLRCGVTRRRFLRRRRATRGKWSYNRRGNCCFSETGT